MWLWAGTSLLPWLELGSSRAPPLTTARNPHSVLSQKGQPGLGTAPAGVCIFKSDTSALSSPLCYGLQHLKLEAPKEDGDRSLSHSESWEGSGALGRLPACPEASVTRLRTHPCTSLSPLLVNQPLVTKVRVSFGLEAGDCSTESSAQGMLPRGLREE